MSQLIAVQEIIRKRLNGEEIFAVRKVEEKVVLTLCEKLHADIKELEYARKGRLEISQKFNDRSRIFAHNGYLEALEALKEHTIKLQKYKLPVEKPIVSEWIKMQLESKNEIKKLLQKYSGADDRICFVDGYLEALSHLSDGYLIKESGSN